eukprot:GHVT01032986.1.p1 GENE.GHVT01032986.1~~GHVT01032986.1.p1  ORF type:complete len:264 (+),score=34.33 GHVT01032986.1:732-1523(+)
MDAPRGRLEDQAGAGRPFSLKHLVFVDRGIAYCSFEDDSQLTANLDLMQADLSEPYCVSTYRHFTFPFPHLCFLAYDDRQCVGIVLCRGEEDPGSSSAGTACVGLHTAPAAPSPPTQCDSEAVPTTGSGSPPCFLMKGYIGMLAVDSNYRRRKIGTNLVGLALRAMAIDERIQQCYLETEVANVRALGLYHFLGFYRTKRLVRYYLNGVDAYRLVRDLADLKDSWPPGQPLHETDEVHRALQKTHEAYTDQQETHKRMHPALQ